jgi:hypothetical protein
MVYVFEGPRNSGKTFLSKYISEKFKIPRYQFAFAEYFKRLNIASQNSREAHAFALGKELMLMQMAKDLPLNPDFIHDRGILTVLAWGVMEGRITESEMEDQVRMIKDMDLLSDISIIFITGDNPDKGERNKDQWDIMDGDNRELESYIKVMNKFKEYGIGRIINFENLFTEDSLSEIKRTFLDLTN